MGETEILTELQKELRLDNWWKELLGQEANYENFDPFVAMDALPRTEVKAAEEVARKFKKMLSFTEYNKRWYIWDGRIHTPCDGEGIAIKVAKFYYTAMCDALEFIQDAIKKEASKIESSAVTGAADEAKKYLAIYEKGEFVKHRAFRDRMATDAGLSALIRLMRTVCDVPKDYFDNDQRWFVMRNCVLDLDALRQSYTTACGDESKLVFRFYSHAPERNVTKFFDADYNPQENLGHWDGFLTRSIPVEESRRYLQMVVGGAFMGTPKMRIIPNLYGPPHSGKSVFVNTLFQLGQGGAGYADMPDSKAVVKVSGQNFDQDSFRGRRFIGISEPPASEKIDDDFLKRFTGDIWVQTRTLNVKNDGWTPQGVVFVASNNPLKINTREAAIVERVQIIEFPIHFEKGPGVPEERRMVEGLENLIMDDRSRILTWILIGMRRFVAAGMKLEPPASVLAKRDEIVTDGSAALRFVEEYIEDGLLRVDFDAEPQYCIPINEAYAKYVYWSATAGERKPLTRKFFTQDIENWYNREKVKIRHGGQNRFFGLTITNEYQARFGAVAKSNFEGNL